MRLSLVSWNVHGWIGRDGQRAPARALERIRSLGADVVALQEAEGRDWEPLARAAGYRLVLGHTRPREFGNALLLRTPLVEVRRIDLSLPGREPRGALDARVELPAGHGLLRIVATHFGLRASERRRQAARLAAHIHGEGDARMPTALLGDLNDWTSRARRLRPLERSVGPLSRLRTFPSHHPVLPLDRAAWRNLDRPAWLTAVRGGGIASISDHLPLHLELGPPHPA